MKGQVASTGGPAYFRSSQKCHGEGTTVRSKEECAYGAAVVLEHETHKRRRLGSYDKETESLNTSFEKDPHIESIHVEEDNTKIGPSCILSNETETGIFHSGKESIQKTYDYICHIGDHVIDAFAPILLLGLVLIVSGTVHILELMLPPYLVCPHTVTLFIVGYVVASTSDLTDSGTLFGRTVASFERLDPHIIFWALLPPLLFEDAAAQHWHVILRVLPNCILIAAPGVIINTVMTGFTIHHTFSHDVARLDIWTSLLMGSILSATDPVAVVGALHSLRAPDKLSSLIAGESLLNDGSAVVLFEIFFVVAKGVKEFEIGEAILQFCRLGLGGVFFGLICSFFLHNALALNHGNFRIQIILVVAMVYMSYFIAEQPGLKVSGVLTVVVIGFYMSATGHYQIRIENHHEYHAVVGFLALISNEAIFTVAGIVAYRFTNRTRSSFNPLSWLNLGECLLLYIYIHISRAVTIFVLWPILRRAGYGLGVKEAIILVFGGLRGAVGLAMAMLVDLDQSHNRMNSDITGRIAFHVSGITLLTLLLNGSTVSTVYRNLHIYESATYHNIILRRALEQAEEVSIKRIVKLERNWFFHNSFFSTILEGIPNLSEMGCNLDIANIAGASCQSGNSNDGSGRKRTMRNSSMETHRGNRTSYVEKMSNIMRGTKEGVEEPEKVKFEELTMEEAMENSVLGPSELDNVICSVVTEAIVNERKNAIVSKDNERTQHFFKKLTFKFPGSFGNVFVLETGVVENLQKNLDQVMASAVLMNIESEKIEEQKQKTDRKTYIKNVFGYSDAQFNENSGSSVVPTDLSPPPRPTTNRITLGLPKLSKPIWNRKSQMNGGKAEDRIILVHPLNKKVVSKFALYYPSRGELLRDAVKSSVAYAVDCCNEDNECGTTENDNSDDSCPPEVVPGCVKSSIHRKISPADGRSIPLKPSVGKNNINDWVFLSPINGLFYCGSGIDRTFPHVTTRETSDQKDLMMGRPSSLGFQVKQVRPSQNVANDESEDEDDLKFNFQGTCGPEDGEQCESCSSFQTAILGKRLSWGPKSLNAQQRNKARANWDLLRSRTRNYLSVIFYASKMNVRIPSENMRGDSFHKLSVAITNMRQLSSFQNRDVLSFDPTDWKDILKVKVSTDERARAEVYQLILNATHARLQSMMECGTISVSSYQLFLETLDHGDEAIAGELRPYGFLKQELGLLHKRNKTDQMKNSLKVVYESLRYNINTHPNFVLQKLSEMIPRRILLPFQRTNMDIQWQWKLIKRDFELIMTFIMIYESQLQEINIFNEFPIVREDIRKLLVYAKATELFYVFDRNPLLFIILEHITAMKLVVLIKRKVLEEFSMLGVIKKEDFEAICDVVLDAAVRTLNDFVPTQKHLAGLEADTTKDMKEARQRLTKRVTHCS